MVRRTSPIYVIKKEKADLIFLPPKAVVSECVLLPKKKKLLDINNKRNKWVNMYKFIED